MCGRYSLAADRDALQLHFDLARPPTVVPRYNIPPGTRILVIRQGDDGREADALKWGLVPFWAKDASIGQRLSNARAETASEKPSFKSALKRRRCLIPADGYYEWKGRGSSKQPYRFHMEGERPFAFAGIWERWTRGEGDPLETTCLFTTSPNAIAARVHHRMPVILSEKSYATWLDPEAPLEDIEALMAPYEGEDLRCYPVSKAVNDARNDGPSILDSEDSAVG